MEIKPGYGLLVSVSNGGHIYLEQPHCVHGEAQVILLTEHEVRLLIKELRCLIKEGFGKLVSEDASGQ
jgi:hypothetical protein